MASSDLDQDLPAVMLAWLASRGPASTVEISRGLNVGGPVLRVALRALIAAGFVQGSVDLGSALVLWSPTDEGHRMVLEAAEKAARISAELDAGVPAGWDGQA